MATVEIDARTAEKLSSLAAANGMTVEEYLKSVFSATHHDVAKRMSMEEVEKFLDDNVFQGPSLPLDFSRADIYDEHD